MYVRGEIEGIVQDASPASGLVDCEDGEAIP